MRNELADLKATHDRLRREALALVYDWKFRKLTLALKALTPGNHFNPDQPRDWHGRWTFASGPNDSNVMSDADPDPIISGADYAAGHHYVPRKVFDDPSYGLRSETRGVFEAETTGRLNDPSGNFYDEVHRNYNAAAREAFDDYLARNNIRSDQMTPEQAQEFVETIKKSRTPAIRNLNMRIWMREIMHGLRGRFRGRE